MYTFMLIQIFTLIVLEYNRTDRERVHIFIAKGHYQKVI